MYCCIFCLSRCAEAEANHDKANRCESRSRFISFPWAPDPCGREGVLPTFFGFGTANRGEAKEKTIYAGKVTVITFQEE